jgi:hypothetical protein
MSKDIMSFNLLPFENESYAPFPFVKNNKVIEISEYQGNRINRTVEISKPTSNTTLVNTLQSVNTSKIARLFNIGNPQILALIASDSALTDLLIEANKQVRKCFPSEKLSLDFIDDMPSKIELSISVSLDDNEVFSKFDEFNKNWWFACSKEATKHLFIVLGFQN